MPIFAQGYRPYTGPVRRGPRALAIAWESFRPRMRWWVWLTALFFAIWPFLVMAVLIWLVLQTGMGTAPSTPQPDVVSFGGEMVNPNRLLRALSSRSGMLFWGALNDAFIAAGPVILPAVACAGILAADRRSGALQIYFARPVSRLDYLVGKILTVIAFCSLLTCIPTLMLWVECAALQSSLDWVVATWYVPFATLAASAIYMLWAAGLILVLSSLLDRPVLIGTVAIFTYFFLAGLGGVLGNALRDKAWFAIIPHCAIGAVTAPLFGLKPPDYLPLPLCLPMAFGFPAICFLVVVRRLRAVEVVT